MYLNMWKLLKYFVIGIFLQVGYRQKQTNVSVKVPLFCPTTDTFFWLYVFQSTTIVTFVCRVFKAPPVTVKRRNIYFY